MITETPSAVMELLDAVAAAAATTLSPSEPLVVGDVTHEVTEVDLQAAVIVTFEGSRSGELAVLIDEELATALGGTAELTTAFAPILAAIADAIGGVVLGVAQELDARLALHRVAAHPDSGLATLLGTNVVRAAVALSIEPAATDGASGVVPFERLDLLRGVEMQASVELGRAKMTVNELLSLRNGAVIELDRAAGEPADLFVNGRLIAHGEVVVVDENYGLRITSIVAEDNRH